jgi:uridine phosphorylase
MSKKSSATAPTVSGKQYHIDLSLKDASESVLLPGDPARVSKIALLWDSSREIAFHREYRTYKGKYQGVPISCTSTGIGAPALAIAVEELSRIGTGTFIRVGTCGAIQKQVKLGDVIITAGAVRLDGASRDYVIPEYPAVSNHKVVAALIKAAENLGISYHVGITASTDTFFVGQGRPGYRGYLPSHKEKIMLDMQKVGVLNFEMEGSCLLTLASLFGKRAGMVSTAIAQRVTDEFKVSAELELRAARVASEAVRLLQEE